MNYKNPHAYVSCGHSVLHLPPYHLELNPIKLMWAIFKNGIADKNVTFGIGDVIKLTGGK
jgi:hypothetical protein